MKIIGIYPGQFQPPHKGHYTSYKRLRHFIGADTFVVTTDYDPSIEAPLHFGDKEQILVRHGVPASHIKKVKNLNTPWEVLENFDPMTTVVIYALNRPDAEKKIQTSKYYQELGLQSTDKLLPFKQRAYIFIINDNLREKNNVYTSKNVREALGSHRFTQKQKTAWFKKFFGWFDLGLFELLKTKYENAEMSSQIDTGPDKVDMKEELRKAVTDILNELMGSPPSIATDDTWGQTDVASSDLDTDYGQTDAELRKQNAEKRKDLTLQKKQAEDEKKMHLNQYQRDKTAAHNYDKYTRKQDQQKIDQINKQMTQNPPSL